MNSSSLVRVLRIKMKIHKICHCCLVIEDKGTKLLTDPGTFSTAQNDLKGLHGVLVTHEHADHIHMDSVRAILDNNPDIPVVANSAVATLLEDAKIPYKLLEDGEVVKIGELRVSSVEGRHAPIYKGFGDCLNTGFLIEDKLFYPGDAFLNPIWPIDILALPIAGPWMRASDAIEYALKLKPRVCFPVHDAVMKSPTMMHGFFKRILEDVGIDFVSLDAGQEAEF